MLDNHQEVFQSSFEEELQEMFIIVRPIGEGAFGKVFQCIDKTDRNTYAIKIIPKNMIKKMKIDSLKTEATILSSINHPNIVKLYSIHETQYYLYLKMQLIRKGTLGKIMRQRSQKKETFTDLQVSTIMKSIFEGVSYIHSFNIIHRDLKPQNILVSDEHDFTTIKIADFGLSTQLDHYFPKSQSVQCGTLIYMAPQILFRSSYNKSIDVWSCSIIMFMLINNGQHPIYREKMKPQQYKKQLANYHRNPLQNQLAENFLQRIQRYDPTQRYSANEALRHPWLTRRCQDVIPLSINQSFKGFQHNLKMHQLIVLSFLIVRSVNNVCKITDVDSNYRLKCQQYNKKSNLQNQQNKSQKYIKNKHIASANHIKQLFGEYQLYNKSSLYPIKDQSKNNIIKKYNNIPKIQQLNDMFTSLFEKKNSIVTSQNHNQNIIKNESEKIIDNNINKKFIDEFIKESVKQLQDTRKFDIKTRKIFSKKKLKNEKSKLQNMSINKQFVEFTEKKQGIFEIYDANSTTNENSSIKSSQKFISSDKNKTNIKIKQVKIYKQKRHLLMRRLSLNKK